MSFTPQTSVTSAPPKALAGMGSDSGFKDDISRVLTAACLPGRVVCGDEATAAPPTQASDVTTLALGVVVYNSMSPPSDTGFPDGYSVSIRAKGRAYAELLSGAAPTAGASVYVYRGATAADRGKVTQDSGAGSTTRLEGAKFTGNVESGKAEIDLSGGSASAGSNAVASELASVANGQGASLIGLEDAGGFTSATDVEAALAELYQDAKSTLAHIDIPLTAFRLVATGAALAGFSDGVADGFDWLEGLGYRFNPSSTAAIGATVPMPADLDDTADVIIAIKGARVGSADTTAALTVGAFFQEVGAAYTADSDAGGATTAFDGATTVVTEETRTLAAADVPAAPCDLSISLVPTAALDADDLRVLSVRLIYKRKLRAS